MVYALRDGKIASSVTYPSEREALEAVGLAE
jgi:ketosteroid isomerase-like protein